MKSRYSSVALHHIKVAMLSSVVCLIVFFNGITAQASFPLVEEANGTKLEVHFRCIEGRSYIDLVNLLEQIDGTMRYSKILQRVTVSFQDSRWTLNLNRDIAISESGEEVLLQEWILVQDRQVLITPKFANTLFGITVHLSDEPVDSFTDERPDQLNTLHGVRFFTDQSEARTRISFDFADYPPQHTVEVNNDTQHILLRLAWCALDPAVAGVIIEDPRVQIIEFCQDNDHLAILITLNTAVRVESGVIGGANPRLYLDVFESISAKPSTSPGDGINARLVILDPGYGGRDSGAVVDDVRSSDMALQVARRIRNTLVKRGYDVIMTRDGDDTLTAEERYALINWHAPLVFISLRLNYHSNPSAQGMEAFIEPPRPRMSSEGVYLEPLFYSSRDLSTAFGHELLDSITARTGQVNRGLKESPFPLLDRVIYPGVILYLGFLSNPDEYQLMISPSYQKLLAEGVIAAIEGYKQSPEYHIFWKNEDQLD